MSRQKFMLACLVILAAYCAGRFTGPKKVEVKEVEKIVYRESETKDEKKNTNFEIIEEIRPDGTKITRRVRNRSTESKTDTRKELDKETAKETKTVNQPDWSFGVYTNKEVISATIDRRIFGGFFLGISGRSELPVSRPEFTFGIRLEF